MRLVVRQQVLYDLLIVAVASNEIHVGERNGLNVFGRVESCREFSVAADMDHCVGAGSFKMQVAGKISSARGVIFCCQ
jgi:hypothetical protein